MCNAGNTYKLWLLINKCRLTWYCPRKLTSESQVMGWMQRSMLTYGFSSLSLARLASALYMCMCGGLWKRGGRDSTCICVDKCVFIYTPLSCLFTVSFYSIWRTPRSGVWITRSFCECANVHLWYIYGMFMVCLWYAQVNVTVARTAVKFTCKREYVNVSLHTASVSIVKKKKRSPLLFALLQIHTTIYHIQTHILHNIQTHLPLPSLTSSSVRKNCEAKSKRDAGWGS